MTQSDNYCEPRPDTLRDALWLAGLFALVKLAVHIAANLWQAHIGWGYFLDEPYYIMCGQKLDWGYVDHGPVVALQARLAVLLFGKSLAGIRMLSALAGAAKVLLTGLMAWQFGARRAGQAIAMLAVLLAGEYLALDGYLSMNSFEPVFWMTAAFAVMRILSGCSEHWWLVFGSAAGLGCENKPSMVFFLAGIFLGLLVTPQRKFLLTRAMWMGVAIALVLVLPNLLWQVHHNWAMLRFLHKSREIHKNPVLGPLAFMYTQIFGLNPLSLPLWGGGLTWLFLNKNAVRFRGLGWAYIFFELLMLASKSAAGYYMAPIYPMLFAAGGCGVEWVLRDGRRQWLVTAYVAALVVLSLLALPVSVPVLNAQTMIAYSKATDLAATPVSLTTGSPLIQFYAFRFGWQELADDVTRLYDALPAADKARAGIQCDSYSEASAINFMGAGRGLPFAISSHNNYFLWGPQGEDGEVMLVVTQHPLKELQSTYASVEKVGMMDHPYAEPLMHATIYLCRGRKRSLLLDWPYLRTYR